MKAEFLVDQTKKSELVESGCSDGSDEERISIGEVRSRSVILFETQVDSLAYSGIVKYSWGSKRRSRMHSKFGKDLSEV